jgi:parallel beta-helix repeat protein
MRRLLLNSLVLFLVLFGADLGLGVTTALAGPCGGGVPCSCDDTVVVNTVLHGSDPVCSPDPSQACSGVGLFVKGNNITLDLGSCPIQGAPGTIGIDAMGDGIVIRTGRIRGFNQDPAQRGGVRLIGNRGRISNLQIFDTGIGVEVQGNKNTVEILLVRPGSANEGVFVMGDENVVSRVDVSDADDGIHCNGDKNIIEKSIAAGNSGDGISCGGSFNIVRLNRVEDNGGAGIVATEGGTGGIGNRVLRNIVLRNRNDGVFIVGGSKAIVEQNRAIDNDENGYALSGSDHRVSLNIATSNGEDGFSVEETVLGGTTTGNVFDRNIADSNQDNGFDVDSTASGNVFGNVFDRNRSTRNDDFGIRDASVGLGTGGTANTYTGNVCGGNGAVDSNPLSLCR